MKTFTKSNAKPKLAAIIVAAGRGERLGGGVPKAYAPIAGVPMLRYSAAALRRFCSNMHIVVAIHPDHRCYAEAALAGLENVSVVHGGKTRFQSVKNALQALKESAPDRVCIHDAARPFIHQNLIALLFESAVDHVATMPVLMVPDTLRRLQGEIWHDVPRDNVAMVQTPQAFDYARLVQAYEVCATACEDPPTDDIAVWQAAGGLVQAVSGNMMLKKVTYPEDLDWAGSIAARARVMRVGSGFDVHRLIAAPHGNIRLGGINIAHDFALEGHSDADVVLHALTDALLGALADGDIGSHFPPSEAAHKGQDSADFVKHAADKIRAASGRLLHVDITLMCEAPKITPHREQMRARISEILDISLRSVSVKATTTEGLGFAGRREGIAVQATVTADFMEMDV